MHKCPAAHNCRVFVVPHPSNCRVKIHCSVNSKVRWQIMCLTTKTSWIQIFTYTSCDWNFVGSAIARAPTGQPQHNFFHLRAIIQTNVPSTPWRPTIDTKPLKNMLMLERNMEKVGSFKDHGLFRYKMSKVSFPVRFQPPRFVLWHDVLEIVVQTRGGFGPEKCLNHWSPDIKMQVSHESLIPGPSKGCRMVPKGCQFTIP